MQYDSDTEVYLEYGRTDNPALFRKLWDKYKNAVLTTIMRITLLPKESAEDILQDIFIKIMDDRAKFVPKAKFNTWLYKITVNRSFNIVRDKKDNSPVSDLLIDDKTLNQLDVLINKERALKFKKGLEALNDRQRAALTLREFNGKSYLEISEIMETTIDAVESLLFHARSRLRVLLNKEL